MGWVARAVWERVVILGPARRFWRLDTKNEVYVAVSFLMPSPEEKTAYIPHGDSLAFGEVVRFLKSLYPRLTVQLHSNVKYPITDCNRTIILIGGPRDNMTTRCLLGALNPPLDFDDQQHPQYDSKTILLPDGRQLHPTEDRDLGFVIRTLNPYHPTQFIYVLNGGYSHGTYGAALWATKSKNLRRLLKLNRKEKTDSVGALFHIPVKDWRSPAPLPLEDGLDHGIGHFMLFEVDSAARAPAPPIPKSP